MSLSNLSLHTLEVALGSLPVANEINSKLLSAQNSDGLIQKGLARATFNFSKQGGAIGTLDLDVSLPSKAVITRAFLDVIVEPNSLGSADIALQLVNPSDILAPVLFSSLTVGQHDCIQTGAASLMIKNSSLNSLPLQMVISGAALTAGQMTIFLEFVISA